MENMQVSTPTQRTQSVWSRLVKKFLRTQAGKHTAFTLGLKGFDRVMVQIGRFMGYDDNGQMKYRYEIPMVQYNARVNAGAALQASLQSGTTFGGLTSPLAGKYVAISTTSLTPAMGDTTLSGETAVSGLTRALAAAQNYVAPVALDGAASFDLYKMFTAGVAGPTVINSSGLFDAASAGNMFAEANLASAVSLGLNDTIAVTWTVNI